VLGLAVAGFFLGRLEHIPDLIARGDAWLTTRDSLGFNTAIPTGEYALIVLLWTLIFFPYLTAGPRMKWLRVILSLAALVVASLCLIISQTRSAWLITPVFVLGLMMTMLFFKRFKNRAILGVAFFSLALLVGLIHENSTVISHRLGQEATTWSKIIHLDFSNITGTNTEGKVLSIGLRFKNIEYGLEKWREKPLFGWGTGAGKMLIDCCAPSSFGRFNDLHNTYVELLVRTGLIGLGLYALLSLQVLRATVDAYRRTATGPEMLLVIIFGLLVHLAISFTSVRILNHDWRFFWFLLAGIALALSTQKPGQTENKLAEKNQPRTGELISRGD
jgi:O-antigen ligase